MKLTEYIKGLNELLAENPEAGELEVFTAIDDEGNGYNPVYYAPQIGVIDCGSLIPIDDIEDESPNAVVVN